MKLKDFMNKQNIDNIYKDQNGLYWILSIDCNFLSLRKLDDIGDITDYYDLAHLIDMDFTFVRSI